MKLKQLQRELTTEGIDRAVFYAEDGNFEYLAQIKASHAVLEIPNRGEPLIRVAGFDADRIAQLSRYQVEKAKTLTIEGKEITGIVPSRISHKYASRIKNKANIEPLMTTLRQEKTGQEIKRIKKACRITDAIFSEIKQCKTERELRNNILTMIHQTGCEPSFTPIIATSTNAGMPHHEASKTKLKGFTIIDFGVKYKGYCSDMSRTVYYGTPNNKEKEIYETILQIQEKAIRMAAEQEQLEEIDRWTKTQIPNMIHKIGHSIGIEVHDPRETPLNIRPKMTLAIEPATYTKQYGIRIEDTIQVKKKAKILTESEKHTIQTFK